jgi:hypothetical protein
LSGGARRPHGAGGADGARSARAARAAVAACAADSTGAEEQCSISASSTIGPEPTVTSIAAVAEQQPARPAVATGHSGSGAVESVAAVANQQTSVATVAGTIDAPGDRAVAVANQQPGVGMSRSAVADESGKQDAERI